MEAEKEKEEQRARSRAGILKAKHKKGKRARKNDSEDSTSDGPIQKRPRKHHPGRPFSGSPFPERVTTKFSRKSDDQEIDRADVKMVESVDETSQIVYKLKQDNAVLHQKNADLQQQQLAISEKLAHLEGRMKVIEDVVTKHHEIIYSTTKMAEGEPRLPPGNFSTAKCCNRSIKATYTIP